MNTGIDLSSVAVEFNAYPTVDQPPRRSSSPQTTDFGRYLRIAAGVNTPSLACSIVWIVLDVIFTIITLTVGIANQSSCPIEPRIPIYLTVSGTINFLSIILCAIATVLHAENKDENLRGYLCVISSALVIILLQLFNFIWAIIGGVWIFSAFSNVQGMDMNSPNYCQGNVYQYSFFYVILQYVLPLIICCCKNLPMCLKDSD